MYTPAHFKHDDLAAAVELIEQNPFAVFITTPGGAPAVTHLPFSVLEAGPPLTLCAHMAKANPQWRHLERAQVLVIFRGVHGYISPRWYTCPQRDVPTWNYTVVHCSGTARIAADEDKHAILDRLAGEMERGADRPWSVSTMEPAYFESLKEGIVAFYVRVEKVEAKFKLSQNRAAADRAGALEGLRATGSPQDALLAAAMERFSPPE